MFLKDYYPDLKNKYNKVKFSGISFNSKSIKKDFIFFAIKGNKIDGNSFINDAIKRGARIIISQNIKEKYENNILYINNKNPRKLLAEISSKISKKKPKNLIAVTGTNGKSSIANFYYQILNNNKNKVASIGTLGVYGLRNLKKFDNTTFDPIEVNKLLATFKKKKIENVILEASSHGLKQHRLDGIKFNIGIFTNLSRDHLDYHITFKDYFNSKLLLFKKLMKKNSHMIYNNNLKISKTLKKISKLKNINKINIGDKYSDLRIISHQYINNDQRVIFSFKNINYSFKTSLIGKIQIYNLLMAILAAYKSNLSLPKIVNSIKKIKAVPGRIEKIGNLKNNSIVILDYAHTPDALEMCLKSIKDQFKIKKITLVFGCGGERDKPKRKLMGAIANDNCDKIYLTDDNPRNENPEKIRKDIKVKISNKKLFEIPSRENAIKTAIDNIKSDEIVIISGKGHETYQHYKTKKYFSDRECIKRHINRKNKYLSRDWKVNVLEEKFGKKLIKNLKINNATINSRNVKKNNIFFGIEGKNQDGNKYTDQAIANGASIAVIDKIFGKKNKKKIKVKNSLKFFTECSSLIRKSSNINCIAITGSSGKTTLKEMSGQLLNKICETYYSEKSYNNKYGIPLSLFNIKKKHRIGIFEVGMDKKGEISYLTKILQPNIGVITNISYAHIKNFKNLKGIAEAKSEIIDNIVKGGTVILNADDKFFNYFKSKAIANKLKIISFSKKKKSNVKFHKFKKKGVNNFIVVKLNEKPLDFLINQELANNVDNILASIAIISNFYDLKKLNLDFFRDYKIPEGRGDLKLIKIKNKKINIIDESYNSNPLSLKFALDKFNKLNIPSKKKVILLGDMLELGKYSKKLHTEAAKIVNKININRVYVYGKNIKNTFNKIRPQKRGRVLNSKIDILNFLKNDIKNNEYLMIKGSNSTGLNNMVQKLKSERKKAI